MFCDRTMKAKIQGKVYRTVLRPALVCGAETWALKKAEENECYDGCAELQSWKK